MIKKKAVLVGKVHYFDIAVHCEERACVDDPPLPEDYNYMYGARLNADGTDDRGLILQFPNSKKPVKVGNLIVIEFVEVDRDDDEVWRLVNV